MSSTRGFTPRPTRDQDVRQRRSRRPASTTYWPTLTSAGWPPGASSIPPARPNELDSYQVRITAITHAPSAGKINDRINAVDLYAMVLRITESWLTQPAASIEETITMCSSCASSRSAGLRGGCWRGGAVAVRSSTTLRP
ncbi:hypothetical protein ACKI1Q_40980 [Streptomyces galilaeus]|uniref:hypothetical protein n=1 Tax=Streptomyces galilaeus TaxID=33899 RepID=UPI0038F74231